MSQTISFPQPQGKHIVFHHTLLFLLESAACTGFGACVRSYHHSEFADVGRLVDEKSVQRISVCIPTYQEESTIGDIVATIRRDLVEKHPLVDEIIVVDSGSTDKTLARAREAGAKALLSSEIRPDLGSHCGKGENLWKALLAAEGDLIVYVDGDIRNFGSHFITGLIGPLLRNPDLDYVKAYYRRPLIDSFGNRSADGGRVSEILVRPMLSLFFPELSHVVQPLAGEYAARHTLLESLPFPVGYGVEIAHLIDLASRGLLEKSAQTDLDERIHRNQDNAALGKTSFAILHVMLRRMADQGKIALPASLPEILSQWCIEGDAAYLREEFIAEVERPPVRGLA
jgi:glucosyl-3-phosphoglycerate synthase